MGLKSYKVRRSYKKEITRVLSFSCLAVVIFLLFWSQNNLIWVKNKVYSMHDVPATFNGYKIAHVSDLCNSSLNVAKKISKSEPDIIIVSGGFADDNGNVNNSIETLNKLNDIAPTYYIYNTRDIECGTSVTESTAKDMTGTTLRIKSDDTEFDDYILENFGSDILKGVERNSKSYTEKYDSLKEKYEASLGSVITLSGIRTGLSGKELKQETYSLIGNNPDNLNILVVGDMKEIDDISKTTVDTVLVGGTFGTKLLSEELVKGQYQKGSSTIFVTGGIGKVKEIDRIFNFPEIQLITLSDGSLTYNNPLENMLNRIFNTVKDITSD